MTKFIQDEITRLTSEKSGMAANAAKWVGQPVTEADVAAAILLLKNKDIEIEAAKDALSVKRSEGRTLVKDQAKVGDQVENLAIGIHASDPEKLVDYDIKLRKAGTTIPVPGTAILLPLKDDVDGIGFIITIQKLDNATDFEIERAITDAAVMTATDFTHLKTTKKLTYVDDDVISGKRYHYRVRGYNRNGSGPVSASVSKTQ